MYISSDWCRSVWAVSKSECLCHGNFYFRVARFTHRSQHPQVDKKRDGGGAKKIIFPYEKGEGGGAEKALNFCLLPPHTVLNDQSLIIPNFEDLVLLSPSEIKRELCKLMSSISQGIDWYKVPVVVKNGKLNETIEWSAFWSIGGCDLTCRILESKEN